MAEASGSKKRAGNMASIIYEQLRSDIVSGALRPGAPLSQLKIAKEGGTSRGPVREALRRLQQDQLVVARTNQRFSVASFDVADLEGVLSLYVANVTLATRVSVPMLTARDLAQLESQVMLMEQTVGRDQPKWEAAYRDFTLTLVRNTGPRIETFIADLIDNIQRYNMTTLDKVPRVYRGGPEFREILEAASTRDGKLTAARFAEFLSRMAMLILAGVAPHHDASRLRGYVVALVPPQKP